ncbi:uroporphyrinogen-III synthase [Arcobacter sp. F2176]|uniref:uroporphyrinogen-III synthase n=1 Tax=unclassified Arcobacter TaxID=2593671 RepID=UPI00100A276E|nr:uroporphyrinogen-III synthase [Arcobacter sp. F2176]RXJ82715.1 uroporphyrinogen III synthase [Arcobacter sp. F2176]
MNNIVLLSNAKYKGIENLPVFDIEYLDINIDLKKYDSLIFTSKNAIYALDKNSLPWTNLDSYAIAKKTSDILKKYNSNVVYSGISSHGDAFAYELIPYLKNKKVLYVKGEKSVSKLFDILKENKIDINELIVYKTICNKNKLKVPSLNSTIIFTSPSCIKCFFDKIAWDESYKAIVIGNTTAKYMPKNVKYKVSPTQSIEACIELAKTFQ